jgi:Protein of unknown function (DUF4229)
VNPAIKYTLGRIGLFIAAFLVTLPIPISIFLKLVIALVISSVLSFFVLRGWREQYSLQLQNAVERRKTEKDKLRSALAGEDEPDHRTDTKDSTDATDKPA